MKNLHIEHPEDTILTGDLSVLDAFQSDNHYSVKIDGSPAIVWGTDPENGKFFVGTKSVFNKRTPKINYTAEDVCNNHPDFELQSILIRCLHCLPHTDRVLQGTSSDSVVIVITNRMQSLIHSLKFRTRV